MVGRVVGMLTLSFAAAAAAVATGGEAGVECASYICVAADSGLVIDEYNADEQRAPASMIKMVLLLMVAEGLENGDWTLQSPITVTRFAEQMGGAQLYLKEGEQFTLAQLIDGVAVASANDAAMAVAEGLWGSRDKYLEAAAARLKEMGLTQTQVRSPHGLPPDAGEEPDLSTARELAMIGMACVQNPHVVSWTSQRELQFREGSGVKENTNRLLGRFDGCDGIKTGFTNDAGYCLTATALRNNIRLIGVVMGCRSLNGRFDNAEVLLENAFSRVTRVCAVARNRAVGEPLPTRNCELTSVPVQPVEDLWVVVPKDQTSALELVRTAPSYVRAPLAAGVEVGEVRVELGGVELAKTPIVVEQKLDPASWQWKLRASVMNRLQAPERLSSRLPSAIR